MNFKIIALIFVVGMVFASAVPASYQARLQRPPVSCYEVGHCIYEHATCSTKIILPNAGCYKKRKCCVTDFFK